MSAWSFVATAASYAWATLAYLVAYRFVLGLAPAASVFVQAVFRPGRILGVWAANWSRTLLLGVATSPCRTTIGSHLTLVTAQGARAAACVAFLVGVHFLTPYYFLLMGPLLGKDALLSHLIGASLCLTIVASVWRPGMVGAAERRAGARDEPIARLTFWEVIRIGPHLLLGLVLAGVVAAWGLSPARVELATLLGGGVLAQVGSAVAGTTLGVVSCLSPVTNLLVATYLWKTGIAHAGLVSFVLASAATLTRRRLYRASLGDRAGRRLWWAFLIAGPLAGIGTAIVFRILGLTIHYRLIPEQLL